MQPLKILSISAEIAPFAKTGGLADVCGALPKALAALGHDVRLVMPAYQSIEGRCRSGQGSPLITTSPVNLQVPMGTGLVPAGVLESTLPGTEVPVYFIAERHRFGDRPHIYGYHDDPFRFSFFSRAALDLVIAALGWRPDVIHVHDWHAAPAIAWLANSGAHDSRYAGIPTVFTIHNLMHQGTTGWQAFNFLGVRSGKLVEEKPGEINFMARGIFHSTMITTVSPTYAQEIMTREGGFGLDNLLRHRHFDVHGILNGLDYDVWNPATDTHLVANFTADTLEDRAENKRALQERLGLAVRPDVPLAAMVTRLDRQKGLDITGHVLHQMLNGHGGEAQCVVLGTGTAQYETMLRHFENHHRGRMCAYIGYDAGLAPLIYAGSDLFLMPSLFEPCGLGQLIAMRYGSVPLVRTTGGLRDTVRHGVTGFTFDGYSGNAFWHAMLEAMHIYRIDQESWQAIQKHGMTSDFSWETSARAYQQVYEWAIARNRGW
ncbi:MAG: glycogen synthase [Gemmataceae bacterium]